MTLLADVDEEALLVCPGGRKRRLLGDELVACCALLLRLAGEHCRRARDVGFRRRRLLPRDPQLDLESLDRVGDALVLVADGAEVIQLLQEVAEALRLEENLELARVAGLVQRDEAVLEPALRHRVLLCQKPEVLRLLAVAKLKTCQLVAVRGQVPFERVELRRERADVALKRIDTRARARDLGRKHPFAGLRPGDVVT